MGFPSITAYQIRQKNKTKQNSSWVLLSLSFRSSGNHYFDGCDGSKHQSCNCCKGCNRQIGNEKKDPIMLLFLHILHFPWHVTFRNSLENAIRLEGSNLYKCLTNEQNCRNLSNLWAALLLCRNYFGMGLGITTPNSLYFPPEVLKNSSKKIDNL